MRAALAVLGWLAATPVRAEDCARYEEPLAYNACLARQGPAAHSAPLGAAPPAARRASAPPHAVIKRGRSEMVFPVRH